MKPLGPILDSILRDLSSGIKQERSSLETLWPQIAGSRFSPHTRATLQKSGRLCVWVDNSVLAYELSQKYRGTLLKRAGAALGEGKIKGITFRVGQIR